MNVAHFFPLLFSLAIYLLQHYYVCKTCVTLYHSLNSISIYFYSVYRKKTNNVTHSIGKSYPSLGLSAHGASDLDSGYTENMSTVHRKYVKCAQEHVNCDNAIPELHFSDTSP
jgi:hypothetical protein